MSLDILKSNLSVYIMAISLRTRIFHLFYRSLRNYIEWLSEKYQQLWNTRHFGRINDLTFDLRFHNLIFFIKGGGGAAKTLEMWKQ